MSLAKEVRACVNEILRAPVSEPADPVWGFSTPRVWRGTWLRGVITARVGIALLSVH